MMLMGRMNFDNYDDCETNDDDDGDDDVGSDNDDRNHDDAGDDNDDANDDQSINQILFIARFPLPKVGHDDNDTNNNDDNGANTYKKFPPLNKNTQSHLILSRKRLNSSNLPASFVATSGGPHVDLSEVLQVL